VRYSRKPNVNIAAPAWMLRYCLLPTEYLIGPAETEGPRLVSHSFAGAGSGTAIEWKRYERFSAPTDREKAPLPRKGRGNSASLPLEATERGEHIEQTDESGVWQANLRESIDFLIEQLQLCQIDRESNSKNVDWVSLNRRKAVHDMVSTILDALDDPSSAIKVDDTFFGFEIGR